MSDENNKLDKLQTSMPSNLAAEWALLLAKMGVSFIPFAGGAAAEVLGALISPHIEHRRTEWLESNARGLAELVERLQPEHFLHDEAFTTAFLHASQVALRTHQQEKLDALRHAVLHVAIADAPDDSLQLMFLNALDTLTPWHLRLLKCVANPREWAAERKYPLNPSWKPDAAVIFEAVHRGKMPAENFHLQLLEDLYSRGLAANKVNPRGQMTFHSDEDTLPHLTDMGHKFLDFIAAPEPPVNSSEPAE